LTWRRYSKVWFNWLLFWRNVNETVRQWKVYKFEIEIYFSLITCLQAKNNEKWLTVLTLNNKTTLSELLLFISSANLAKFQFALFNSYPEKVVSQKSFVETHCFFNRIYIYRKIAKEMDFCWKSQNSVKFKWDNNLRIQSMFICVNMQMNSAVHRKWRLRHVSTQPRAAYNQVLRITNICN